MFRIQRSDSRGLRCWRLYGFRAHYRLCIVDWAETTLFAGKPAYRRLKLFGWTLFERNREYSGLPTHG